MNIYNVKIHTTDWISARLHVAIDFNGLKLSEGVITGWTASLSPIVQAQVAAILVTSVKRSHLSS